MEKPTKYRRPFDWRLAAGDDDALAIAAQAFVGLSVPEYSEMFEDYLEITRKRRSNRAWLAKVQLHLLEELANQEHAVKHYRKKQAEFESELKSILTAPDLEQQKKQLEVDVNVAKRQLFFHRAYANCIRAIGDGIAWRSLGYDRAVMRALCQAAVKPHVLSEGVIGELHEWSRTFDTGEGIAILNCLTNCLSVGDITVVRNDGTVEIVEVKASRTKSRRITRQKQKMRELVELLNFGHGEIEDTNIEIQSFDILPENGLSDVLALLEESERSGWASRRLSNCLYIQCIHFRAVNDFDGTIKGLDETLERETARWRANKDFVIRQGSHNVIAFTPNCAPFSIFPFPARTCVDLLTHAKSYWSYLNLSAICREFENRGWCVEKRPEELLVEGRQVNDPVLIVNKGAFHAEMPPAAVMRMQMETLRPQVFIQELEMTYQMGPKSGAPYRLAVYNREPEIWR